MSANHPTQERHDLNLKDDGQTGSHVEDEVDRLDREITEKLGLLIPDGRTKENIFYLDEAYERENVELLRTFRNNITNEYDFGFVWSIFEVLRNAGHEKVSEMINPVTVALRRRLLFKSVSLGFEPDSAEFIALWSMAMAASPEEAMAIERIVCQQNIIDTARIREILSHQ